MKSLTELHPQIIIFSISRSLNGAFSQTKSKLLLLEIKLLWIKSNKSLSVLSPSKKCSIQRLQQRKGIICFLFSLRTSLPEIVQDDNKSKKNHLFSPYHINLKRNEHLLLPVDDFTFCRVNTQRCSTWRRERLIITDC